MTEPRLDANDRAVWARWLLTVRQHSRGLTHKHRVDEARRLAGVALDGAERPAVMWSGGKDSTAMAHLVHAMDPSVLLVSEKDDLDYPGEREYVEGLAQQWGARLQVLVPPVSPQQWIAGHAHELTPGADIHGRTAELSKLCFYNLLEESNAQHDVIFIGLRAEESLGRRRNRRVNGPIYTRRSRYGHNLVCTPLADWAGIDVYAYLLSNDIDPLHVYRCVGFVHARQPWAVRKSWWLPGLYALHGGTAWLRRYYPSLYRQLTEWMPRAQSMG